ncbi:hypothetical protein Sjap_025538 [Stephania japonica]|uniref:F-box domain-containing protein n=1 Tax=Stephania japonica TaxID=461633 RepID=A0AAP0E6B4_9MAGN
MKRKRSSTPTLTGELLPDELISYIFSFLSPRDLTKTCLLLSKRWRDFWVSTNLNYPLDFEISSSNNSSIAFFQQFMKRRSEGGAGSSTVLQRLSVKWRSFGKEELLGNLITTALDHHVQELHISFPSTRIRLRAPPSSFAIPSLVFSAPRLRTLVLHNVEFTPGQNITCPDLESLVLKNSERSLANIPGLVFSAPKLRTLELHNAWLTPEQNIMALKLKSLVLDNVKLTLQQNIINCLDLETLVLKNRLWLSADGVLKLCSANLKKLEVENYNKEFELHTPKLSSFSYKEKDTCLECWFGKIDALSSSKSWSNRCDLISRCLKDSLLRRLPVEEASHVGVSVKGEPGEPLVLERILSSLVRLLKSYHNLRSLELITTVGDIANFPPLASSVIRSFSYFTELLVLKVVHESDKGADLQMEPWPLSCTLDKLKCIVVQGLTMSNHQIEFLRLLYNRAVNGERMVIIEEVKEYLVKASLWMDFASRVADQCPFPNISCQYL